MASFKEQCGLPIVAKLKQCIQSLATRLQSPEGTMGATMVLKDGYPCLEALVSVSEPTRKLLSAYDTVSANVFTPCVQFGILIILNFYLVCIGLFSNSTFCVTFMLLKIMLQLFTPADL